MGEVIVITSGKGGVGKTTTTANLGSSLAVEGKKVCLIDTDIGLRNLDVVMGLENRIVYDIVDVVEEKCKLRQALIKDKRFKELYLLPAAQTRDKSAVNEEQMKKLTDKLKEEFDYILIDCPAGIEQGFKNAIAGADRAIVVTTAFYYHPLWPVVLGIFIIFPLWKFRLLHLSDKWIDHGAFAIGILFLLCFIIRHVTHSPIVQIDFTKGIFHFFSYMNI